VDQAERERVLAWVLRLAQREEAEPQEPRRQFVPVDAWISTVEARRAGPDRRGGLYGDDGKRQWTPSGS
jgi:hypothetical protein